jgi:3D (Asp-Asp-Asp) domain-containing protein
MGNPCLREEHLMSMAKPKIKQRWMSLFRLAMAVALIGLFIHVAHRECARIADQPFNRGLTNTSPFALSKSTSSSSEVFQATAYCLSGITRSGTRTMPGLVSADPDVIPLGSVIYVDSPRMGGIYQVLDTGDLVKGKIIDIFIPSYEKCMEFGRRIVKVKVLRYGFHDEKPKNEQNKK